MKNQTNTTEANFLYTYNHSMEVNHPIEDVVGMNEYLRSRLDVMSYDANERLEQRGAQMDAGHVIDMGYTFDAPTTGRAWMKTDAPLSDHAVAVLSDWSKHQASHGYVRGEVMMGLAQHSRQDYRDMSFVDQGAGFIDHTYSFTLTERQPVEEQTLAVINNLSLTDEDLKGLEPQEHSMEQ